jgi:hypothetical protein
VVALVVPTPNHPDAVVPCENFLGAIDAVVDEVDDGIAGGIAGGDENSEGFGGNGLAPRDGGGGGGASFPYAAEARLDVAAGGAGFEFANDAPPLIWDIDGR